jgi:hypothetical protein
MQRSAQRFYDELVTHWEHYSGSDVAISTLVFSNWKLKNPIQALNCRLYAWHYGNAIHGIIRLVFQPHFLLDSMVMNSSMTMKSAYLSESQVHNAYCMLFRIIHQHGIKHDMKDYYGDTPAMYLSSIQTNLRQWPWPEHIQKAASAFHVLLKYGPSLVLIQQAIMKKALLRIQLKKKKQAVAKIENWWLNIVLNPYSRPGTRLLQKNADVFKQKYQCDL